MSYVGGKYKQDVFFSYAHGNDRLHMWSHRFADSLRENVEALLNVRGEELHFWTDKDLPRNEPLTDVLQQRVSSSAALVVVMTGFYTQSPWCAREAAWFAEMMRRDASAENNRIFVVRAQNIADAEWPSFFRDHAGEQLPGYWFCDSDKQGALPWRFNDDDNKSWGTAMTQLAGQLATFLRNTRQAPPLPEGPRVFVGFATEDLEEDRAALAEALAGDGRLAVVAPDWPADINEIHDVVKLQVENCSALIQLCGRAPGRWKHDGDGFIAFQVRAFEEARKPQWLVKAAEFDPIRLPNSGYGEMLRIRGAKLGKPPDVAVILKALEPIRIRPTTEGPHPELPPLCTIFIRSRKEYRFAEERLRGELAALPAIAAHALPFQPFWMLRDPGSINAVLEIMRARASELDAHLLIVTEQAELLENDILDYFSIIRRQGAAGLPAAIIDARADGTEASKHCLPSFRLGENDFREKLGNWLRGCTERLQQAAMLAAE